MANLRYSRLISKSWSGTDSIGTNPCIEVAAGPSGSHFSYRVSPLFLLLATGFRQVFVFGSSVQTVDIHSHCGDGWLTPTFAIAPYLKHSRALAGIPSNRSQGVGVLGFDHEFRAFLEPPWFFTRMHHIWSVPRVVAMSLPSDYPARVGRMAHLSQPVEVTLNRRPCEFDRENISREISAGR